MIFFLSDAINTDGLTNFAPLHKLPIRHFFRPWGYLEFFRKIINPPVTLALVAKIMKTDLLKHLSRPCIPATLAIAALTAAYAPVECRADEYRGEKTLGVLSGYNNHNKSALIGIAFSYRFNKWFRIAPDVEYALRKNREDALMTNINTQYLFRVTRGVWVYPQAGLNFTSWNYHPKAGELIGEDGTVKTIERKSNIGLNLGAGADVNLSSSLRLSVSPSYVINKHSNFFNLTASIAYRF